MKIFSESAINNRRERLAQALNEVLSGGDQVIFFAGKPITKPGGLDQTYIFLPHPEYFWISGNRFANGAVVYQKGQGWTDYVQQLSLEDQLWEGIESRPAGKDIRDLQGAIEDSSGRNVYFLGQVPKSYVSSGARGPDQLGLVQEAINEVRRIKDEEEVALVRMAAQQASAGYLLIKNILRPGLSERQLQIEYEAAVQRAGAEKFPYDTIIGSGANSAILHALPTARVIQKDELVLVDAGADVVDYCVDITRTFSSTGEFTTQQSELYEIVKSAQESAIQLCTAGTEWHIVHRMAAQVIAQGLRGLNLLSCTAEEALDSGAISCFFPHGVGHMVGLRVRDVGGSSLRPLRTCCGVRVRVDFPLKNGFLMTVEPGIYFVKALLNSGERRSQFKSQINWSETEKWIGFGGIRLEDDILITEKGPLNLTEMIEK